MLAQDEDIYIRALFGANVRRGAGQIVLQDHGEHNGQRITSFVGFCVADLLAPAVRQAGMPHELLVGEAIFRPRLSFTGKDHLGDGLAGLIRAGVLPSTWSFEVKNGVLVPQEHT